MGSLPMTGASQVCRGSDRTTSAHCPAHHHRIRFLGTNEALQVTVPTLPVLQVTELRSQVAPELRASSRPSCCPCLSSFSAQDSATKPACLRGGESSPTPLSLPCPHDTAVHVGSPTGVCVCRNAHPLGCPSPKARADTLGVAHLPTPCCRPACYDPQWTHSAHGWLSRPAVHSPHPEHPPGTSFVVSLPLTTICQDFLFILPPKH